MKVLFVLLCAICVAQLLTPPASIDTILPYLDQTFADEFDTFNPWDSSSQTGTWQTMYPWGSRTNNDEFEYYSDSSVGVNPFNISNGVLRIEAKPATGLPQGPSGRTLNYTSGIITTSPSFHQQYGYFEMDSQLPYGPGFWPAFWLLPTNWSWPPEIDILEAFGAPNNDQGYNDQYHYAIHSINPSNNYGDWVTFTGVNVTNSFHRYGALWTNESITFYFDGSLVITVPSFPEFNQEMYILANLAVGGSWPGGPTSATPFPAYMDINYIRAWSLSMSSTTGSTTTGAGTTTGTTTGTATTGAASSTSGGGVPDTTGATTGHSSASAVVASLILVISAVMLLL